MIPSLAGISAAFGLASSAGLNAYIPLLIVALFARIPLEDPLIKLAEPYNLMTNWWIIVLLVILLFVEMSVDKIPLADTINDIIQTFIRPSAGAILFDASADVITDIHPILAFGAGLIVAGGVHTTKLTLRPIITASTAGTGNWLVSLFEDIIAFFISLVSILLPILAGLLAFLLIIFIFRVYWKRRNNRDLAYR